MVISKLTPSVLGSATLTIVGSVIAFKLTQALSGSPSLPIVGARMAAGIIITYLLSRVQARSQEESPEAIKWRLSQLEPELRKLIREGWMRYRWEADLPTDHNLCAQPLRIRSTTSGTPAPPVSAYGRNPV
jgi:hypothetical protein